MSPLFKVLISAEEIRRRIPEMAREIGERHRGRPIKLVAVMHGGAVFCTLLGMELQRQGLVSSVGFDDVQFRSRHENGDAGTIKLLHGLTNLVQEEDVLIVDDVIDRALTVQVARDWVMGKKIDGQRSDRGVPASCSIVALISKPDCRVVDVDAHVLCVGFILRGKPYLAGLGLDFHKGGYRFLDHVIEIPPEILAEQNT